MAADRLQKVTAALSLQEDFLRDDKNALYGKLMGLCTSFVVTKELKPSLLANKI